MSYLVSDGNPSYSAPGISSPQAGEIALFEAQIGQWGQMVSSRDGLDHAVRIDNIGGDTACFGGDIIFHDGLLLGGCGGRVDVVFRGRRRVDGGGLDDFGDLEGGVGHDGWYFIRMEVGICVNGRISDPRVLTPEGFKTCR